MKLQKLQIKSFTSSAYDDNIIEKQANKDVYNYGRESSLFTINA
jgi:hypothetical protein